MEEIKDTNTTTTQQVEVSQDVEDNSIASAKKRVATAYEKKIASDYISLEEYNNLKAKYDALQVEVKQPQVKQAFVENGGKEECFNDWIKLNENAMKCSKEELSNILANSKEHQKYMFEVKEVNTNTIPQIQGNVEVTKPTYELDANGMLKLNR